MTDHRTFILVVGAALALSSVALGEEWTPKRLSDGQPDVQGFYRPEIAVSAPRCSGECVLAAASGVQMAAFWLSSLLTDENFKRRSDVRAISLAIGLPRPRRFCGETNDRRGKVK